MTMPRISESKASSGRRALPRPRSLLRTLAALLLGLVVAFVGAELLLQGAALFVRDRSGAWRPGAAVEVLCVGDSHTFGAMVAEEEAYPEQMQQVLDGGAPGRYSVLNLGVPGMSTTQVRHRLPRYAARYEPDVIVVWAGVNNVWNQAELEDDGAPWRARLDALLYHSRLVRLARVWLHDRSLAAATERANRLVQGQIQARGDQAAATPYGSQSYSRLPGEDTLWRVGHGAVVEPIHHGQPASFDVESVARRADADYRAMAQWASDAGVAILFVTYPTELGPSGPINAALRSFAASTGATIVETGPALARVPEGEREFLWALHPNAAIYAEIARDVAAGVQQVAGDG